jgi:hypothetical protein
MLLHILFCHYPLRAGGLLHFKKDHAGYSIKAEESAGLGPSHSTAAWLGRIMIGCGWPGPSAPGRPRGRGPGEVRVRPCQGLGHKSDSESVTVTVTVTDGDSGLGRPGPGWQSWHAGASGTVTVTAGTRDQSIWNLALL